MQQVEHTQPQIPLLLSSLPRPLGRHIHRQLHSSRRNKFRGIGQDKPDGASRLTKKSYCVLRFLPIGHRLEFPRIRLHSPAERNM